MIISILTMALSLAFANDGASSGPVGGLVLQKEENILMKKETLKISPRKISVDYVFENKSGNDVETFIQFPLPIEVVDMDGRYEDYNPKFSVVINGKAIQYNTTHKIYSEKDLSKDLTEQLKSKGFLKGDSSKWAKGEDKWSEKQKKELIRLGVLDYEGHRQWYSQRVFYWKQKFPANQELKVHHEYEPLIGGSVPNPDGLTDSCADEHVIKGVKKNSSGGYSYVDYILTTANTWKTPIEDFTLIIQKLESKTIMSTCFEGLQKISPTEFQVNKDNFIPKSEIRVYFFHPKYE